MESKIISEILERLKDVEARLNQIEEAQRSQHMLHSTNERGRVRLQPKDKPDGE
jgi:hypothetical protein